MATKSDDTDTPKNDSSSKPAEQKQQQQPEQEQEHESKIDRVRVGVLGFGLILFGMYGFYFIPGMIKNDAEGSKLVNAFYCSVMTLTTIGFGDICPDDKTDLFGRFFLMILPLLGLGFFCGPMLELGSSWSHQISEFGTIALATLTLALGASMLIVLEDLSIQDAIHLCIMTGTTIGYGDITPSTDLGRFLLAVYALLVCNVMSGFLNHGRLFLERFCQKTNTTTMTTTTKTTEDKKND